MVERSQQVWSGQRIAFAAAGTFLTFVGTEFGDEGIALWYQSRIAGIPVQYIVLAAGAGLAFPFVYHSPRLALVPRLKATHLWNWIVLGYLAVTVALAVGLVRSTDEPFVDWRNWAVIAMVSVLVARWLAAKSWKRHALTDLAIGWGLVSCGHLVVWLFGGGTQLFDVRVPLFDGYDLTLAATTAILTMDLWIRRFDSYTSGYTTALRIAGVSGGALVLLSFRRSLWLLLASGIAIVLARSVRARLITKQAVMRISGVVVLAVVLTIVSFGWDTLGPRLASINPLERTETNAYAATNEDHLNDLVDAWNVVRQEPVFGLGIGTTYRTLLVSDWKEESFEVHNAYLNAWLKFGVLGLVAYTGLHFALIRAYVKAPMSAPRGLAAAGVALAGEQLVALVQPWPYNSFQFSIARALVLGIFLACISTAPPHARQAADVRITIERRP